MGNDSFDESRLVPAYQFPGRPHTVVDTVVLVILFVAWPLVAWRWLRARASRAVPTDDGPEDASLAG